MNSYVLEQISKTALIYVYIYFTYSTWGLNRLNQQKKIDSVPNLYLGQDEDAYIIKKISEEYAWS